MDEKSLLGRFVRWLVAVVVCVSVGVALADLIDVGLGVGVATAMGGSFGRAGWLP